MRKLASALAVMVATSGLALAAVVAEKTITGQGQCAKCSLSETPSCQNAVIVEEGGKKVTYYLVHNDVSKKFHGKICKTIKKVKATGEVEEKEGKQVMTPSKIDEVE